MNTSIPPVIASQETPMPVSQDGTIRVALSKVRPFTGFLFVAYMSAGVVAGFALFVFGKLFQNIFRQLSYGSEVRIPFLTRVVFGIQPGGWVAILWCLGALLVLRDIKGMYKLFPNWAAALLLIVLGLGIGVGFVLPILVFH